MQVLSNKVKVITVSCSPRLNELLRWWFKVKQEKDNTWFNKKRKGKLTSHLNSVSIQVSRHIRMQHKDVLVSVSIDRVFGKSGTFTSKIVVGE